MAVTAHATDLPVQQPLTQHPVVSEPPIEVALLLAQAVAQMGTSDWDAVTAMLDRSDDWPVEAGKMTSQGYAAAFDTIMQERGLDSSACSRPLARPARKLVHALYSSLLDSLRTSILQSFKEEMQHKEQIAALRAAHLSPSPEPGKDDKQPSTPTAATRKSARNAASIQAEGDTTTTTGAQAKVGEDVEMSSAKGDVAGQTDDGPAPEDDGDGESEAEQPGEGDSATTPSKKDGMKRKVGVPSTAAARRKGRGTRATTGEGTDTPASEQDADDEKGEVKQEEDDDVEDAEGGGAAEMEEEAEEEEEDDDAQRPRRGARKGRTTPAATAAKKGAAGRKRKPSEAPTSPAPNELADSSRKRKRVKTTEEPAEENEKDVKLSIQRRKAGFTRIIEQLQAERYSHFFESRVTKSIAPLYNVVVRRPTCLRDILKAIKSGAISTSTELMRDVALLCANAIQFNGDDGEDSVGHCAKLMWDRFERLMDESLSAEMSVD